jgi:alpha-tubulin suppressor-like RCC1 family protein/uncharacterized protein YjdB
MLFPSDGRSLRPAQVRFPPQLPAARRLRRRRAVILPARFPFLEFFMPQHPRFFHHARLLAFALAVSLTGACNDSTGPGRRVNSVEVSPPNAALDVGATQAFSATLRNSAGDVLTGRTVVWTSSAPAVAAVSATGMVMALAAGTATITATSGGRSGAATVVVSALVESVTVTAPSPTMAPGATQQLTATARDAAGNVLTGRSVTWSTNATAIATVSASGVVSALSPGTAVITATIGGRSGSVTILVQVPVASVTVSPPGATLAPGASQDFTATARDAAGNVLTGRPVTWSSSAPSVAPVSATGVVTALTPGTAIITATVEGRSGTATVVVPAVSSVTVSPAGATVLVGTTRDFTATARDAAGNVLTGRPVTWSTSDPNVATVSATGVVTGVGEGTAIITATVEGRSGTATVTVERVVLSTITAGGAHTCGLTTSGTAYCWGGNDRGQLGDGTRNNSPVPVPVAGGHTFAQIDAGYEFTVALTPSGAAYAWGHNFFGQVGDGTRTDRLVPVPVAGGHTFTSVSAGLAYHTLALKSDGTAWAWGGNAFGQVGNGTQQEQDTPVPVAGGHTWQAVSAGGFHSLGITTGGQTYAWGTNRNGQLGYGALGDVSAVPQPVSGGHTFTAISGGAEFTLALDATGGGWAWGSNSDGQLGDGTLTTRTAPVPVANSHTFRAISAGGYHSVALTPGNVAYAWGQNHYGQLGIGSLNNEIRTPATVAGGIFFRLLSAGGTHTCGISTAGRAYCWGSNFAGQLGAPTTQTCPVPRLAPFPCSNVPLAVSGTFAAARSATSRGAPPRR